MRLCSTGAVFGGNAGQLDHSVDAVIDPGDCGTKPATVIDFSGQEPEIVLKGPGGTSGSGEPATPSEQRASSGLGRHGARVSMRRPVIWSGMIRT
jgi:hypothetical protein